MEFKTNGAICVELIESDCKKETKWANFDSCTILPLEDKDTIGDWEQDEKETLVGILGDDDLTRTCKIVFTYLEPVLGKLRTKVWEKGNLNSLKTTFLLIYSLLKGDKHLYHLWREL